MEFPQKKYPRELRELKRLEGSSLRGISAVLRRASDKVFGHEARQFQVSSIKYRASRIQPPFSLTYKAVKCKQYSALFLNQTFSFDPERETFNPERERGFQMV